MRGAPCQRGFFCCYCHERHWERRLRLSRSQKLLLERVALRSFLEVLSPCIEQRAARANLSAEARGVLLLLAELEAASLPTDPGLVPTAILATLQQMTMAALCGLVLRRRDLSDHFLEEYTFRVAQLRARLP